jgi:uncharacterized cupredoxin-like copper-binding protein
MVRPSIGERPSGLASLSRRLMTGGIVLLLLGVALFASAAPVPYVEHARAFAGPGPAATVVLNVTATDTPSFVPHGLSAVAGTRATFSVENAGSFPHTFSLFGAANDTIPQNSTPTQLDALFARSGTTVNLTVAPGTTANATFAIPASWVGGSFEFVSLVPYQFQAGMFGFLNVTSASSGGSYAISVMAAPSALQFVPSAIQVNATSFPIHIQAAVSNAGTTAHTWTLDATPNENLTPTGFASTFQAHPPAANINIPTSSGVVATANFTLTQKGVYEFICTVPGHFAAGMYGYLYVGVPAPAAVAPPSTAIVELWVLVAAGVLLGVGVLLAVAAAFTGRFAGSETTPRQH